MLEKAILFVLLASCGFVFYCVFFTKNDHWEPNTIAGMFWEVIKDFGKAIKQNRFSENLGLVIKCLLLLSYASIIWGPMIMAYYPNMDYSTRNFFGTLFLTSPLWNTMLYFFLVYFRIIGEFFPVSTNGVGISYERSND